MLKYAPTYAKASVDKPGPSLPRALACPDEALGEVGLTNFLSILLFRLPPEERVHFRFHQVGEKKRF